MVRKFEKTLPYGDEQLTRDKLFQRPEVLSYLRRNGVEKNSRVLLTRFYRELKKGNITKEIIMMQEPGKKMQEPKMVRKPEKIYPYGDEQLTRDELLEKPEVLGYLRRNGVEKNKRGLLARFYKELRKGNITKEIVTGQEPRMQEPTDYEQLMLNLMNNENEGYKKLILSLLESEYHFENTKVIPRVKPSEISWIRLNKMTKVELNKLAKSVGIKNYINIKKHELIEKIERMKK